MSSGEFCTAGKYLQSFRRERNVPFHTHTWICTCTHRPTHHIHSCSVELSSVPISRSLWRSEQIKQISLLGWSSPCTITSLPVLGLLSDADIGAAVQGCGEKQVVCLSHAADVFAGHSWCHGLEERALPALANTSGSSP